MGNPEGKVHGKGATQVSKGSDTSAAAADEFVHFWVAGENGKGEFRCSECSYGVTIHTKLPVCPMCAGESWEQTAWSPFSRAERPQ